MIDISGLPILSLIIATPLVGAILLAFLPGENVRLVKQVALGTTLVALLLSLLAAVAFGKAPELDGFRYTESVAVDPVLRHPATTWAWTASACSWWCSRRS